MENKSKIDVNVEASVKAEATADLTNLVDESVVPTTRKLGDTIASLLEHIFGDFILSGQKKEAQRQYNLECFIEKLESNKNLIPEEHIQEPKLSIVGPALEASRYYMDEEILRDMFANLVSNSLDATKNKQVHESYVEIIKQLSSLDAKHLIQISKSSTNPIIHLQLKGKSGSGFTYFATNVYLSEHINLEEHELISSSLINLKRLGLIDIPEGSTYTEDSVYENLFKHPYIEYQVGMSKGLISTQKGIISITSFGRQFCQICF